MGHWMVLALPVDAVNQQADCPANPEVFALAVVRCQNK
jgi:hypothetical protein